MIFNLVITTPIYTNQIKKVITMEEEIWKDVEGSGGDMRVSSLGRVWREKYRGLADQIASFGDNGAGYKTVGLSRNVGFHTGKKTEYVHRLVAKHFLTNPDNLPQVGHRDNNKENNSVSNLYWCTGSRNIRDAHKTGRMQKRYEVGAVNILSDDVIMKAYEEVKRGAKITPTAEKYGMPRTSLSSIMNKRSRVYITDIVDWELSQNNP